MLFRYRKFLVVPLVAALLFTLAVFGSAAYDNAPNILDNEAWEWSRLYDSWDYGSMFSTYDEFDDILTIYGSVDVETSSLIGQLIQPSLLVSGHTYLFAFDISDFFFEQNQTEYISTVQLGFAIYEYGSYDVDVEFLSVDAQDIYNGDFTTFSYSFTAGNYACPYFGITCLADDGYVLELQHFRLVDVTLAEADEQTNKIGGFFDNLFSKIEDFFTGFLNLILYFNVDGEYTNPFTFGSVGDLSEHLSALSNGVSSFADSIADFISPVTAVCLVLDEIAEALPIIKVLVPVLLMGLVLVRLLGI